MSQLNKDILEENDRNIRVYGSETQQLLFQSEVFIYGLSPCSSELIKDLILSGVKICLFDYNKIVDEREIAHNFFTSKADLQKSMAKVIRDKFLIIKPNASVEIIKQIEEIKNKQFKFAYFDLNEINISNPLLKEIENVLLSSNCIIYFSKFYGGATVCFNNLKEIESLKEEENLEIETISDTGSDSENNEKISGNEDIIHIQEEETSKASKKDNRIEQQHFQYLSLHEKLTVFLVKPEPIKENRKTDYYMIRNIIENIYNISANLYENIFTGINMYLIGGEICREFVNCISQKNKIRDDLFYFSALNSQGFYLDKDYFK